MKTVVIYNSQTGFTERYARWIAEAAGAECVELKEARKNTYDSYDAIVFGGWACAGGISGLKWFKSNLNRWEGKKLIVYCVGGSPADSPEIATALRNNFSADEWERIRAFYCPGGFSYERMSLTSKIMMKVFVKAIKAKKDKTEEEKVMAEMVSHSYDISDRKYVGPVLECLGQGQ